MCTDDFEFKVHTCYADVKKRAKRMSGGRSRATYSGKSSLKKCKMKKKLDNVVVIDVDSDDFPNVIVIDEPECSQQELRGSGKLREGKKVSAQSVISIDDDDESDDNNHPGIDDEGRTGFDSDATSSKRSFPPFGDSGHAGTDSDYCEFVWERRRPVKLSNCKRTFSGKNPCRTRYGLGSESESGSFDSDCSDCEVMEGCSGKLREQWEKAFSNRKCNFGKSQSTLEDQGSASGTPTNGQSDVESENLCEQRPQVPIDSTENNANNENGNPCDFIPTDFCNLGGTSVNPEMEFENFSCKFQFGGNTVRGSPSFTYDGSTFQNKESNSQGPCLGSECNTNSDHEKTAKGKEQLNQGEPCLFNSQPHFNMNFGEYKANVNDKEAASCKRQHQHGEKDGHATFISRDEDKEFYPNSTSCKAPSPSESQHENNSFCVEEKASGEHFTTSQPCYRKNANCSATSSGKSEISNEISTCHGKDKQVLEELSTDNTLHCETQVNMDTSSKEKEPFVEPLLNNPPLDDRNCTFRAEDVNVPPAVESCIINEREKLKETEEYKRAVEEEWAARQCQLQIQAEEAKRLRKRKKAENMRLLDMERRQKQRLEEVRATQKKDEENLNLKDQLRVEIRNKLKKLEMTSLDMASLLRGLEVPVQGGVHPSSHEVHAAYKRALLRFHPDRTSRTNIRQQVEAEEKFKLISRMKEKLLLSL